MPLSCTQQAMKAEVYQLLLNPKPLSHTCEAATALVAFLGNVQPLRLSLEKLTLH